MGDLMTTTSTGIGRIMNRGDTWRDLVALAAAAVLLNFLALGARDLWAPNEPIYGRAVVEMSQSGDWLVPTVNGRVFAEKPILYYWVALMASKLLGGVSEFSLRVPSALAGVASVILTYLLALPYVGRRRALLSAVLFSTLYQVFWAARAVQMDILVLVSTLGVLVPLTRVLDFRAPPVRGWALAGLAAGLGVLAKGPVALILPGLVILAYAISRRRLDLFLHRAVLVGIGVGLVVGSPWYALLALRGETAVLHEVLLRQNFSRFVDAWDHRQPWWYFLQYVWTDYAPWSWLLPAAWLTRPSTQEEGRLRQLSWIWIVAIIAFFSLSQSKRAPYILPIAPAVAFLAAGVVERLAFTTSYRRAARTAAVVALSVLASIFLLAGLAVISPWVEIPPPLAPSVITWGLILLLTGVTAIVGLIRGRGGATFAPLALLLGLSLSYLIAASWTLPAVNPWKSARGLADDVTSTLATTGGELVSYRFWKWRAGYSFYAQRSIRNLQTQPDLEAFWGLSGPALILVEEPHREEFERLLPTAEVLFRRNVGHRTVTVYAKPEG